MNQSNTTVFIKYEVLEDAGVFPIFHYHPSVCVLNSSNQIEWSKEVAFADEDTLLNKVSIALPPKTVLVFGNLNNDSYKTYDQKFINGRVFNLRKLQLISNNKIQNILPSTFDSYFKKHKGQIQLIVK